MGRTFIRNQSIKVFKKHFEKETCVAVLSTCTHDSCPVFIIPRLEVLKLLFSRLGYQSSNYKLFFNLISRKKEKNRRTCTDTKNKLKFTQSSPFSMENISKT